MTMMNRREFVYATAGSAVFAGVGRVFAADKYDLIVKGGRVIDPSLRLDAVRDVAIAGGRIAAVQANIPADGAETLDARGKIVVPGLLDIHTHAARVKDGPALPPSASGSHPFVNSAVGSGVVDPAPAIAALADAPNVEWLIVELDHAAGPVIDAVSGSIDYLVGRGLARSGPA